MEGYKDGLVKRIILLYKLEFIIFVLNRQYIFIEKKIK